MDTKETSHVDSVRNLLAGTDAHKDSITAHPGPPHVEIEILRPALINPDRPGRCRGHPPYDPGLERRRFHR